MTQTPARVLIYRLGSLGDTVVALPCFHLIARVFKDARRHVLTNVPVANKAPALKSLLDNSGLVHGYLRYPIRLRGARRFLELAAELRRFKPDVLIYLVPPRGRLKVLRDAIFFRSCGIRALVGVPYARDLQDHRWLEDRKCFESEAARLARCLASLGDAHLEDPSNWNLHLTALEERRGEEALRGWPGNDRFIACSIGTKFDTNDWGEPNWRSLLARVSLIWPDLGLVFLGATDDFAGSGRAGAEFSGPKLNLCGSLAPRESATLLKRATAFIGHDSGPMHLAASVGTPCVAIFSARNEPGVWFPWGTNHKVIYHQTHCHGCGLAECKKYHKMCITSVTVTEVEAAIREIVPSTSSHERRAGVMSGR